jgi:YVTN family beta-propeller protein
VSERRTETVTLLFTDLEGSTRLLKQLRDRYADALAEHEQLLREIFAAHGGVEVDTQGDSFFVAFPRPRAAVLAAVQAQRALAAHAWPDGVALLVRMGMHTGEASVAAGRYVGVAVHRAARICAAGHGGQVLVSGTTKDLLEDEEAELAGVDFVDLGDRQLKDLDRPIRLYQLAAEGLGSDFPPVRTSDHVAERGITPFVDGRATTGRAFRVELTRRRATIAVIVVLLVAALAIAVLVSTRGGDETPTAVVVRPNSVGIIDVGLGRVVGQVPVGAGPDDVAANEDRAWVANRGDGTIAVVDSDELTVARQVPVARDTGLAFGYGTVWVGTSPTRPRGIRLLRLDPISSNLEQVGSARPPPRGFVFTGYDLTPVATGLGSAWVASGTTLLGYSPESGRLVARRTLDVTILDVAAGAGSVWIAGGVPGAPDASPSVVGQVAQFNPTAGVIVRTIDVAGGPSVAVGEGAVWIATVQDNRVTVVDPTEGTVRATIEVGEFPTDVAVGAGSVWVANRISKTVSRIDPESLEVVETIPIGGFPEGLAVAGGRVWVTVQ